MAQKNLRAAKTGKNDEFYTQLPDIEKELHHYRGFFRDKVVFCNCDDPECSNFWKYFQMNFFFLGLKKLISTHYEPGGQSYKMEIIAADFPTGQTAFPDYVKTPLEGDGDFRSEECVEILKEADVVVTNPPFSLFREFVAQLIRHEKQFIIIGSINAVTYKSVFPLIKNNKMWIGPSIHSGDREFRVPPNYPLDAASSRVDDKGNKYIRVKGVRWFTNVDVPIRHKPIELYAKYCGNEERYPRYDNYDAINVDKTCEIPVDYQGIMGVPITFLDKYSPDQFVIVGCSANPEANELEKKPRTALAQRLIQQRRLRGAKCVGGNSNIYIDNDAYVHVVYHRVFIRYSEAFINTHPRQFLQKHPQDRCEEI